MAALVCHRLLISNQSGLPVQLDRADNVKLVWKFRGGVKQYFSHVEIKNCDKMYMNANLILFTSKNK